MMSNDVRNKKILRLAKYVFAVIFIAFIVSGLYNKYRLDNEPVRYAIAEVTNFTRLRLGPELKFEFHIRGQKTTKSSLLSGEVSLQRNEELRKLIGKRFVVQFNISNPNLNRLMIECPVPDSIMSIPAEGWEHPPFGCGGR
jgi:hypothetical protein